jgi:cytoskeletal protein CcmA (bactofilin family)
MFRTNKDRISSGGEAPERVTSVLGEGISWQGKVTGRGGVRIEGAFDGEISVRGLVVIAASGRVTSEQIQAETIIVAGSVKGDITAKKVEIARTGRVWGSVVTASFATDEGAFLKGQITMEDDVDLEFGVVTEVDDDEQEGSGGSE